MMLVSWIFAWKSGKGTGRLVWYNLGMCALIVAGVETGWRFPE